MRVGVEVGGTFTDLVMVADGRIRVTKVPSTPARPDEGALAAIAAAEVDLSAVDDLVHGSTVATNAILERKGARICLFTTAGFRDVLFLQRHSRRRIYDLFYRKPEPVLHRRDIFEIDERMGPDGRAVRALDPATAESAIRAALAGGDYEAVAICFLNAYADPAHEAAVAQIVRRLRPELNVTCSHDVCREFREYERSSTTTLAAYVQPVIERYLNRFAAALKAGGHAGRFSVMQSNGGRLPADAMGRNAITSLFSGPAAGVIGAARMAARAGFTEVITLDMGGTSTDVCLVEGGRPSLIGETEIDGLPIKTPVIDIATVGAGGGSLIWIDDGGLMRVGPHSAGADPGPACYGRGGTAATVTDAHLVRGTIRGESFLGGRMALDMEAAAVALREQAGKLGLEPVQAADAAIQIADANITQAIQRISTERGKDPRDYALLAFGGAGPMQAARIAEDLGLRTVLVPPHAGVLSAWGLLASDFVHYAAQTRRLPVAPDSLPEIRATLESLSAEVQAYLRDLGLTDPPRLTATLEMRYLGQAFEIPVEAELSALLAMDAAALSAAFDRAHHQVFEFSKGGGAAEIVSFRVGAAVAPAALPDLAQEAEAPMPPRPTEIFERGRRKTCTLLPRSALAAGDPPRPGPLLVEDGTSTIYVPDGWTAAIGEAHCLVMRRAQDQQEDTIG